MNDWKNTVHVGDCLDKLEEMPDNSVHTVIFSPPYWKQREYNGGERELGQEKTLDEYIANLVEVGDKLKRVLRDDGSWWLNLGDKYVDKDKCLMPHKTAIALQQSGWLVRNDACWRKKGGGMPESIKNRLSKTFEFVFHFVQQQDYWYDLDAIREPYETESTKRAHRATTSNTKGGGGYPGQTQNSIHEGRDQQGGLHASGSNPGDLFVLPTASFSDAHFATYPEKLVEKPLKATCPPKVCPDCGTPYERVTEQLSGSTANIEGSMDEDGVTRTTAGLAKKTEEESRYKAIHKGWEPACDCDAGDPEPGIVLDPFMGAGTTGVVAQKHHRWWTGIELNEEYAEMAEDRIAKARRNNPDPDADDPLTTDY